MCSTRSALFVAAELFFFRHRKRENQKSKIKKEKRKKKGKMPKCKPVLWPRSDYWSTHRRELKGLLLSQKNEVSEAFGGGGSLNTAIYRVCVVDESGAPLLQVSLSASAEGAEEDLAWAKGFAGSEAKWKTAAKLANAFIYAWNKAHSKQVTTQQRKTEPQQQLLSPLSSLSPAVTTTCFFLFVCLF